MPTPIRRIVTAQDELGRSFAKFDGTATNQIELPRRHGVWATQLWVTDTMPVTFDQDHDPAADPIVLQPPLNGSAVRFVEFPPEREYIEGMDGAAAREGFEAIGASDVSAYKDNGPHPLMHRTRTIDYEIVLSGEIYLILDRSEHLMRAGDIAIQRGTSHAWANRSDAPCMMAFIQLDADQERAASADRSE